MRPDLSPDIEARAIDWVIRQRDPGFSDWDGFADWLAAWNSSDNAASMSIEAWGMNGELLASARSSEITQLFFLSRRSVSIQLPENTWKLRAVMHFPRASRALIDEIRLAVGSVDLTANDQVPIPWTH